MAKNKVCLIVIDGWGISNVRHGNAIFHASTPVMDKLAKSKEQYTTLNASGLFVGLPVGLMGNSEVGHLNIGAGRIMYQDIVRINIDIFNRELHKNKQLISACKHAKNNSEGRLHFLGLISDGGVHAHIKHLFNLIEAANKLAVGQVYVHFFSDGRDTSPTSAINFIEEILTKQKSNYSKLATIIGRYYAMDRDKRWERIKIAYEALVQGIGEFSDNPIETIEKRYKENETDEFIKPIILNKDGMIRDNDTLIFFNYRSDRVRQITESLGIKLNFETNVVPKNLKIVTMTQYNEDFPFEILYPPITPKNVLSEVISNACLTQFHCAETEKYAHVTFFFNGGQEKQFENEYRFMIPSPKVSTYDLKPEMSVKEVALKVKEEIEQGDHSFIMCNFAPPDMVGHTGNFEATVKAVTATDEAIGIVLDSCNKNNYILLVTSDHGNAEKMLTSSNEIYTAHTTNCVPFCITGDYKINIYKKYGLCDIAPTILDIMGLNKPTEMFGKSLLD